MINISRTEFRNYKSYPESIQLFKLIVVTYVAFNVQSK